MIDYDILARFNTTDDRLREIFTADGTKIQSPVKGEKKDEKERRVKHNRQVNKDIHTRENFQRLFQSRLYEHIYLSLRSASMYQAVDLMWDTPVITQEVLPLLMYAQGKINVDSAKGALMGMGGDKAVSKFIKKVGEGDQVRETVDLPRFVDSHFNMARSLVGRRHAAQKNKYNQLWPFYAYEARDTSVKGKCRADVMSQVAEEMVDQFGYRHHDSQVIQDAFLYAHSVDFPRKKWETESQIYKDENGDPKSTIVREGIAWHNPHPSRVICDNSHPICSLNTDSGCEFVGFYDIMRYRDVEDNPWYYNKGVIGWSSKIWSAFNQYTTFMQQYGYTLSPPMGKNDLASNNDRQALTGIYNSSLPDSSIVVTNYFHKCVPKDCGLGDYPNPLWIRFVIAADYTVIYAEIMPSSPAAVCSIHESDSRQVNVSMAMEAFVFQDAMSNLMTHMRLLMERELVTVIGINTDVFDSADQIKQVENQLRGRNWFADPIIIRQSYQKVQEMLGPQNSKEFLNITQTSREPKSITDIFVAMAKLVEMSEKLFALSPNEQGQPAPREITATESSSISTTTSTIYSAISSDVDNFRAAKKRIIYESVLACQKGQIVAPVKGRYSAKTVQAAGFQIRDTDNMQSNAGGPSTVTVIGTPQKLQHDYVFTSRDGDERPVNTQAANSLVQLLGMLSGLPGVLTGMGKDRVYGIINEIFRLSGSGYDLILERHEGEPDTFGPDDSQALHQAIQQLTQMTQQLAQHVTQNSTDIAKTEQELKRVDQSEQNMKAHIDKTNEMASILTGHAKQIQGLLEHKDQTAEQIKRSLSEAINYKDAPHSIQRQIEAQAGFQPAPDSERAPIAAPKPATTTKK